MGPTRKRDLAIGTVVATVVAYGLAILLYHWFPPITVWTGLSLLLFAAAEVGWAFYVRAKIRAGDIGVGGGRIHPLAVARSLVVAKASAWLGALVLGWWLGVLVYVAPRQWRADAAADTPGSVVAAVSALALVAAAVWLQHCCRAPLEPPEKPDGATE
ncbi:DUF3180 domain-containing protein [Mycobacterium sp. CBMA293]|uniref:DUF3180 domain-containing protein n=1 Tax=unclassified Mycolicibacterium TaxID=2636767 RepID=UPI0012DD086C|nr:MULTISPECIES: DUF3180 domain-containing protein [unclassified Mycolicibacterium]MUL46130.1 DUF3180 domain-containing protein [Mycolicibacterium sp. CBMA 360]MUL58821.1 DUF3180 domain-containing protein [Mycolicibacterium sp. CBMA 335]MUL69215.1 DUF3180 domain-containing protein [Mycolicibacterium sp. CBMA 311]MUL94179.1 DUF3180 domain-containing protein [Mycolicibacterium sp. CBMA 230]MUM05194.1 hypothetical protein [Mycolicibacterium sp. CBMA 213]